MKVLTEQAQSDRNSFEELYGKRGNCSCFQNAPCASCMHPGNPHNQEDNEFWESDNIWGLLDETFKAIENRNTCLDEWGIWIYEMSLMMDKTEHKGMVDRGLRKK